MKNKANTILLQQISDGELLVRVEGKGPELAALIISVLEGYPNTVPIFLSALALYCNRHKIAMSDIEKIAAAVG